MDIKLIVSPQDLDFIAERMIKGKMDYATAQKVTNLMTRLSQQANDPTVQSMRVPEPPKER